jgi:hypothetical protein
MTRRDAKIVAATLTVVGALLSILDKVYAPHHLRLESSPDYPDFLRTLGWLFLLIAPFFYIALDVVDIFGSHRIKKEPMLHKKDKTEAVVDTPPEQETPNK